MNDYNLAAVDAAAQAEFEKELDREYGEQLDRLVEVFRAKGPPPEPTDERPSRS